MKIYPTVEEIEECLEKVCEEIYFRKTLSLVAISRGGLVPARYIAKRLGIRRIYSLGIEFYDDDDSKMKIPYVYQRLTNTFKPEDRVLIVDDIADSGETFKIAIKEVRDAGAEKIETCTIHYKPQSAYKPTYIGKVVSDKDWIVFPWE